MSAIRPNNGKIGAVGGIQQSATESTGSLGPGRSSGRTLPNASGSAMSAALSSTSTMAPSRQDGSKRYQLVQALTNSIGVSAGPTDKSELLQHKVGQVFQQIATMTEQQLIDRRPGTTQIFTLPEFFWNNKTAPLSTDDKMALLQMLEEQVAHADYENAVFVLGTVVTSEPPANMARLNQADFASISPLLGHSAGALASAHDQAMNEDVESFSRGPKAARIDLTATASLAAALVEAKEGRTDGPIPPEALVAAAQDINLMKANQESLAIMVGFGTRSTISQNLDAFLGAGNMEEAKEALDKMCPDASLYTDDAQVTQLQELLTEYRENMPQLFDLAKKYKQHYVPFLVSDARFSNPRTPQSAVDGKPALQILKEGPKADLKILHEQGRQMFKALRNEAIVLDGGRKDGPRLIQKYAPSEVDAPGYSDAKPASNRNPPQHDHYRSSLADISPSMPEKMMSRRLNKAGYNPNDQVLEMPRDGATMGLVICRDIDTHHFESYVSETVSRTEVFQLISAGIIKPTFQDRAPTGPLLSHNDGTDAFSQVLRGPMKRPVAQNIYEQPGIGADFELRPSAPQPSLNAGDRGAWSVSGTVHRPNAPASDPGSLTDNRAGGDRAALQERADHYTEEITGLQQKLSDLDGKGTDEVNMHGKGAMPFLRGLNLPISADLANAWEKGRIDNTTFLATIRTVIEGEITATMELRDNALAQIAHVVDRSDS